MTHTHDSTADHRTAGPGGRRMRTLAVTAGAGLAATGLAVYLKRRLPQPEPHTVSATTVDQGAAGPDPAHAPGHTHLEPPEHMPTPPSSTPAGRTYERGHRDRGGRSTAFHTERGA